MSSSAAELRTAVATGVLVTDEALVVELSDGRTVSAPLVWFPRLMNGRADERGRWTLIGRGAGIHWPDLDEDISVEGLLLGRPSGESPASLQRWLDQRSQGTGQ